MCNVDIGIGERHRRAFLQRLAAVKDALIPTPNFILVVGNSKNRSGGPLDTFIGCSRHNLAIMRDGDMKIRLEDVARIVEELRCPIFLEAMANLAQQMNPPSHSHILVMEAVMILLAPQTAFGNHVPLSPLRGVTWTEARHILELPDMLWAAVARVDECNIPPANILTLQVSGGSVLLSGCTRLSNSWRCGIFYICDSRRCQQNSLVENSWDSVSSNRRHILFRDMLAWLCWKQDPCLSDLICFLLQAYIAHDQWPLKGGASATNFNVLDRLAAWVCSTVEFSILLEKAGGCPLALCHYSTTPIGLLATVVAVHDGHPYAQRESATNFKQG